MIIIADSGSSKTHWRAIDTNGEEIGFETIGLNPYHIAEDNFSYTIKSSIAKIIDCKRVQRVIFYGAGCSSALSAAKVNNSLSIVFPLAKIEVNTDILGAARAVFGHASGLIMILGTGTNLGYFDGITVRHETPSLGYVLGDEGSGTYMGKLLLSQWLYGELPGEMIKELENYCTLTIGEMMQKIYSESSAVSFLSGFTPFILKNAKSPALRSIINSSFVDLIERHLLKYKEFPQNPVGVVGSIGTLFRVYLENAIQSYSGKLEFTLQYPIEGLVDYHKSSPF